MSNTTMITNTCEHCHNELGKRKHKLMKDVDGNTVVVHAKCASDFQSAVNAERIQREKATRDAEWKAFQERCAANKERRGPDLDAFVQRTMFSSSVAKSDEEKVEMYFAYAIKHMKESAEKELAEWKTRLEKDAAYAFEWSFSAFGAAAKQNVSADLIRKFLTGVPVKGMLDELLEQVLRGARSPGHSSSPTSNLMAESMTKARAELLELRKHVV